MLKRLFNYRKTPLYFFLLCLGAFFYITYKLYAALTVQDWLASLTYFLLDSVLIVPIGLVSLRGFLSNRFYIFWPSKVRVSKLKKRIITAFSIGAAVPTILVAIFAVYFLNFGVEAWFDNKIVNILNQSENVGKSYIKEHKIQLKETAIAVANDLSSMYYSLINNPEAFYKVINAQSDLRSFDEGIVFEQKTHTILAQTLLSFSLAYIPIEPDIIERANRGEVVEIQSDHSKIRFLTKLKNTDDTFLLIGRLVDPKITNYIDETNGALKEYDAIKSHILSMQVGFSLIFICFGAALLGSAILWGRSFSNKIVRPITELVRAAEKVKGGDLTAQVPLEQLKKDEIKVLSVAFNNMVRQLDFQQKELITAQRALAWSDVARRVAHEIKNPLTPIQLSAERLTTKFSAQVNDPETFTKYVNNILKHSKDIQKIVTEFVEFARLPKPVFALCDIYKLINELVESRQLINPDIQYRFDANVEQCPIACDVSQINRVFVNLLLNAEEALIKRSLGKKIIITLEAGQDELTIVVSDNGEGFSEKILEQATTAYVTTKPLGSGLGLAIVNRIILDHFGEIFINNNHYDGGEITLKFDLTMLEKQITSGR